MITIYNFKTFYDTFSLYLLSDLTTQLSPSDNLEFVWKNFLCESPELVHNLNPMLKFTAKSIIPLTIYSM